MKLKWVHFSVTGKLERILNKQYVIYLVVKTPEQIASPLSPSLHKTYLLSFPFHLLSVHLPGLSCQLTYYCQDVKNCYFHLKNFSCPLNPQSVHDCLILASRLHGIFCQHRSARLNKQTGLPFPNLWTFTTSYFQHILFVFLQRDLSSLSNVYFSILTKVCVGGFERNFSFSQYCSSAVGLVIIGVTHFFFHSTWINKKIEHFH